MTSARASIQGRALGAGQAFGAALAAASLLVCPAPALARAGEKPSPELDRFYLRFAAGPRELARMTGCLVNQKPEVARNIFDVPYGAAPNYAAGQALFTNAGNCLFGSSQLRASGLMSYGAVAEHLRLRDKVSLPAVLAGRASATQAGGGQHLWTWRNVDDAATQRIMVLSQCLLERHPDQVTAILDARQTSEGEFKLFSALNDEVDACVPRGETWMLQPQVLRAALAINFYIAARAAAPNSNRTTG